MAKAWIEAGDHTLSLDEYEQMLALNKVDEGSAFDQQNFNAVLLILLNRIYDVQIAMLSIIGGDGEAAKTLIEMHKQGLTLAPEPAWVEYAED